MIRHAPGIKFFFGPGAIDKKIITMRNRRFYTDDQKFLKYVSGS
jgi:hypothetical protein